MHLHHHGCRHGQSPPSLALLVLAFGNNATIKVPETTDSVSAPARPSTASAVEDAFQGGYHPDPQVNLPTRLHGDAKIGDGQPASFQINFIGIGAKTGACGGQATA